MGYFTSVYTSELPHRAVTVFMYLRNRADKEGKCYPAIGTIARELKLSRSTVKRAIKDLEKSGVRNKGGVKTAARAVVCTSFFKIHVFKC